MERLTKLANQILTYSIKIKENECIFKKIS